MKKPVFFLFLLGSISTLISQENNNSAHCQLIQDGEIQAIIGDASRNGHGGTQYCGIWSLTSRHRDFNAFGNSYAGLLPGEFPGVGSNIAPGYISDQELEVRPEVKERRPFHWDRIDRRFDEPFYYGRLGEMVLILIFDKPQWLRFFMSPSGGGASIIPGKTCPAWDFEWIIPESEYKVGKEYNFRVRLVYKKYVDDNDVMNQ